jgi:hypothetical protein
MSTPKCPKCSQPMEEGFIVDHGYGKHTQAEWVEGPPQTSFWTGLKLGSLQGRRKVTTFCCPKYGFLESYAETE